MPKRTNPIVRAVVMAAAFALAILVAQFIRDVVMEHGTFSPDWALVGAGAGLSLAASLVQMLLNR